jgi:uncharacterized protein YndB with AHSA1/START domain
MVQWLRQILTGNLKLFLRKRLLTYIFVSEHLRICELTGKKINPSINKHFMSKKNPTIIKAEPGKQEIFIIREFEAPRELVWKAHTDPEIMKNWLGPRELKITIEKFEPYVGGSYRYIHTDKKGNEFAFRGVVHEFIPPGLSIQTFEYEGMPEKGHVIMETSRFESLPGNRTRLTVQSVFQSVADRDGMMQSGMERGVLDSHERLDEILAG